VTKLDSELIRMISFSPMIMLEGSVFKLALMHYFGCQTHPGILELKFVVWT